MRKNLLLLVAIAMATSASAQFYVSASGGYSLPSAGMKLGEEVSTTKTTNYYGSYGEGANFQFRGGYFFNETFGLETSLGYLHGADQTIQEVKLPNQEVDAVARARAFGFSTSIVYNFTKNIYGRFGAVVKVGGKTEAVVYNKEVFSDGKAAALGLPSGSYSVTEYVEDYHGEFPLGFTGAFGYKHNIGKNLDLFIEAEYIGISVKRKDSEIQEFNTDIMLPDGTVAVAGYYSVNNLPPGYVIKTNYEDERAHSETDPSIKLSEKVPYSSFGINFGITYTFAKKATTK
ncbi:MAG TPA: outer membrane beta-barrel protein [Lutibacter sp.]